MEDNFKRIEAVMDALCENNKKISDNLLEINSILSGVSKTIREIRRTIGIVGTNGLRMKT
jgi:hypothetical protein